MAAYIHYSNFDVLRRSRQIGHGACRRFLDALFAWLAALLLIGCAGCVAYLLYLLLLKEFASV